MAAGRVSQLAEAGATRLAGMIVEVKRVKETR
jgi:hypothetical protein